MARPTKSATTRTGNLTREEKKTRLEQETKLKGKADKISPSSYLTAKQKKFFKFIVEELDASGILGNLDIFVLETCAIAIDRLQTIETMINQDPEQLMNKNLMATKEKYTKDLWRSTNELSLSPQSRAKLGNINVQAAAQEADPLLKLLKGGK
jgi:P27 family predicted phage terminase small subunit